MKFLKKSIVYLVGFNILVFGIAMLISSGLGQSAWDGVYVAISRVSGLSVGKATFLTAASIISFSFLLTRDKAVFLSLITSVVQSSVIDIDLKIVRYLMPNDSLQVRILFFAIGLCLMAIGCGTYIQTKFPTNHVDCLMVSISRRFNLNIRTAKWISDSSAIIITLLIAKKVILGTLIVLLFLAPMVQFVSKKVQVPILKFIDNEDGIHSRATDS